MNQFDQTVGGGIASLLAQNQEVMGEPGGAFNFAPKNEPVLKMADGGMTFSDDQVAQAIRESMAQGFTLDQSIQGAANKFGVPQDQLSRVSGSFAEANPANLIQQLNLKTPDFAKGFDFSQIGKRPDEAGEVIQGPSTQFGGYDVRALGQFADVGEGSYAPTGALGGYEATKSEVQANGKPLISTLKYDPAGALTGSTVRAYEGSDSGTEYTLDAAGKVVGSRKFDESEAWKGTALPLLNMAAIAGMPWLSGVLGGGALGAAGAGALFGGTGAALRGAEGSNLLKAAAMGALGGAGGSLASEAGKFAGGLFEDPLASAAAKGAVEGGIKALPGAIATGDVSKAFTGALVGGGMGAADVATSNVDLPFTKQQLEAGVNLARAVSSGNMMAAVNSAAALIDNPDITIATKAATLLNAARTGNTSAVVAAAQLLDNALREGLKPGLSLTTPTTKAVTGEDFDLDAIARLGDITTLSGAGDTISGELPETISGLGVIAPDSLGDQTVSVTGGTLPVTGLGNVEDLLSVLSPSQVEVTGKKYIKPVKGGEGVVTIPPVIPGETNDDRQFEVIGKRIKPVQGGEGVATQPIVTPPVIPGETNEDRQFEVIGKRIKPVQGGEGVATQPLVTPPVIPTETNEDDQVEVIGKRIKPVKGGEGVAATTPTTTTTTTTPTTTSTPTTTTTVKPITTTTTTYETPTYTPIPEAAPAQPFRPGVVTDAYEVLFGPGAPSLMGFTKAERAKQMLARGQEEGENQPQTAYDHLMSMADKDPVGTVDRLMKIVNGESA